MRSVTLTIVIVAVCTYAVFASAVQPTPIQCPAQHACGPVDLGGVVCARLVATLQLISSSSLSAQIFTRPNEKTSVQLLFLCWEDAKLGLFGVTSTPAGSDVVVQVSKPERHPPPADRPNCSAVFVNITATTPVPTHVVANFSSTNDVTGAERGIVIKQDFAACSTGSSCSFGCCTIDDYFVGSYAVAAPNSSCPCFVESLEVQRSDMFTLSFSGNLAGPACPKDWPPVFQQSTPIPPSGHTASINVIGHNVTFTFDSGQVRIIDHTSASCDVVGVRAVPPHSAGGKATSSSVVGISTGSVVGVALVIIVIFVVFGRRRRRQRRMAQPRAGAAPNDHDPLLRGQPSGYGAAVGDHSSYSGVGVPYNPLAPPLDMRSPPHGYPAAPGGPQATAAPQPNAPPLVPDGPEGPSGHTAASAPPVF